MPEVTESSLSASFQFMVTVQSEKSETVVLDVCRPERLTSIGAESPMTPQGI